MENLILLTLATFFAWETVRYVFETYSPVLFQVTRVVHPLLVLTFPLIYLWPNAVDAMAVAGVTGILHTLLSRAGMESSGTPVQFNARRSRRGGLPDLP